MRLIETIDGFRGALDAERAEGRTVGLVPTMGALHEGHLSLVRRAAAECDVVAVTIFVNPLQFDDGDDLLRYPRSLEADQELASGAGAAYMFAPSDKEMYPDKMLTSVSVAQVAGRLENESRPGHFEGVATVVTKLLAIAGACRSYFGEKDHQQLVVVTRLVQDLSFPVEVVACPTVREHDGLVFSSRNVRLSPSERAAATVLHRALLAGVVAVEAGQERPGFVSMAMARVIAEEPLATLEYADVIPESPFRWRLLVAARIGDVRLIDNMRAQLP
ncbi:MAG TPA: pantoate--beta-alanine ligase [Acidimicrobiales bacterium]|nr:pantoate--beta-alanine ligase [Acidimicrobiales bacterium]